MLIVRDIFRCKPGKAGELIDRFKRSMGSLENMEGFNSFRILVDYIGPYWTVILESEVDDLAQFEKHMEEWSASAEVKQIMAGYVELLEGGYREVFKVV